MIDDKAERYLWILTYVYIIYYRAMWESEVEDGHIWEICYSGVSDGREGNKASIYT